MERGAATGSEGKCGSSPLPPLHGSWEEGGCEGSEAEEGSERRGGGRCMTGVRDGPGGDKPGWVSWYFVALVGGGARAAKSLPSGPDSPKWLLAEYISLSHDPTKEQSCVFSALASQPWSLGFPIRQTPPFTPDQTCQRDNVQTRLSSLSRCLWTAYEAFDRSNVAEMQSPAVVFDHGCRPRVLAKCSLVSA